MFHVTNQRAVSWYEFVREIVGRRRRRSRTWCDRSRPPSSSRHAGAPRPANSVLDNAALRAAGLPLLRDFGEPLARARRRAHGADAFDPEQLAHRRVAGDLDVVAANVIEEVLSRVIRKRWISASAPRRSWASTPFGS